MKRLAEHDHVRAAHTGDRDMEQGMAGVRVTRLAPRGADRRVVHGLWSVLGALLLITLGAPAGAFATARVTPQDRAATHAYLEAEYTYDQSQLASAPASTAAVQALAGSLEAGCPGVLLGAPHETLSSLLAPRPPARRSPRQEGEERRENRQWSDLQLELGLTIALTESEPNREAALAYAHAVRSLHWSSKAVTAFEQAGAVGAEADLATRRPEVCADMRVWVLSGYKTLSAETKTLIQEEEARILPLFRALREGSAITGLNPLLRYEGPREKLLARKIGSLARERLSSLKTLGEIAVGLEVGLGVRSKAETELHGGPPNGSVEIAHGGTAAGGSYTIWVEPKNAGSGSQRTHCPISVAAHETETNAESSGAIETGGGESSACLSRSHPKSPRVKCEEGNLTIEAQTLARARTVRLHLSDGRQITSRVAYVPARLGGPAGFYYQVVRGPSPVPVSLTEVDAQGRALRNVKLPRTGRCVKPKPVRPLIRTIVNGHLPQGPGFSILGERGSYFNRFNLRLELGAENEGGGILGGGGIRSELSSGGEGEGPMAKPSPFARQLKTGCRPHEYAILYGILSAPRDTVLARSAGSLQPLRRVRIPASLRAHGVLAYIALPAVPSEVVVRSPNGKTLRTEKLAGEARKARETCEGEAEGPA